MSRTRYFETDDSKDNKIADDFFKNATLQSLTSVKDRDTAIANLKQALNYNRQHWPAMFNLGVRMHTRGSFTVAIRWFSRCLAIKSDYGPAYENACLCNLKIGQYELAHQVINKCYHVLLLNQK